MHMYTLFPRTLDKIQCIKTQYFILKTKIALAVENAKKQYNVCHVVWRDTTCFTCVGLLTL